MAHRLIRAGVALVPPGRITVSSTPTGALACIDSRDCDTTGATFTVEGNAWHTVRVTEKGYLEWTDTVFVTSDQTSTVDAYLDLDRNATGIQVYVTPGGGTVCLDNGDCRANVGAPGTTGSTRFTGVSPGYHTISVEAPVDYVDTTKLEKVELGKVTEVDIVMDAFLVPVATTSAAQRTTGTIRVYVDRTGSTICIDNANCMYNVGGSPGPGTGTTVFDHVTANETHIVTVAADGYEPFSAPVSVGKDLIAKIDVTLRPMAGVTTVPTIILPPVTTVSLTTSVPSPTTIPTLTPIPTRSGLDAVPVIGALALCSMVFLFRKNK